MKQEICDPDQLAAQILAAIRALPVQDTESMRSLRRQFSLNLKQADPAVMFNLAYKLIDKHSHRWFVYELLRYHKPAFHAIDETEIVALGTGMNSWDSVDSFARILSGPVWLNGQISNDLIHQWAGSDNVWWRRAALVSTVALNVRSQGGYGDTPRTIAVCQLLADDHEDMIEKALSWALRELVIHDPDAVKLFLSDYDSVLATRVKREVKNKLTTGLKQPRKPKI